MSPERIVTWATGSLCERSVSLPTKPPYTETPSFRTKAIVRVEVAVGL
jgi:hypothetical protein